VSIVYKGIPYNNMMKDDNTNERGEEETMPTELIQVKRHTCYRCGYKWIPRSEEMPVGCPRCKSPYWNRPKKSSGNENANQ